MRGPLGSVDTDFSVDRKVKPVRDPVRVTVTGAAGQIGYSLVFRVASGAMLGPDQPVVLHLLEIPPAMDALAGVCMELEDCALPLLGGVVATSYPSEAFEGASWALLVGSRPRTKGMERRELLEANGDIFTVQGKALSSSAADDVRVLVVGNPANTNCLIAMENADGIPAERFSAMTRLDHNRAMAQVAGKVGVAVSGVRRMTIWGNHSASQYPDVTHAEIGGRPAADVIDDPEWIEDGCEQVVEVGGYAVGPDERCGVPGHSETAPDEGVAGPQLGSCDPSRRLVVRGEGDVGRLCAAGLDPQAAVAQRHRVQDLTVGAPGHDVLHEQPRGLGHDGAARRFSHLVEPHGAQVAGHRRSSVGLHLQPGAATSPWRGTDQCQNG